MKELYQKDNRVFLCRGKGCCPNITNLKDGQVQITDDDGNKMVLTKEQALMIPEAIKTLESNA